MKKENYELLLSLGFKQKEIIRLQKKKTVIFTNIEELVSLLGSIHIFNIRNFLLTNPYLFDYDIIDVAKTIETIFEKTKDYRKTKKILIKTKFMGFML